MRSSHVSSSSGVVLKARIDSTAMMRTGRRDLIEKVALHGARTAVSVAHLVSPIQARLFRRKVRVTRNVPYLGTGDASHTLDVYTPRHAQRPLPIVMYVHGGAFEVCSKDTHFIMAQAYARAGYLVFNVNYKLAPEHPFPNALRDVCAAYLWVLDNAARFGGDLQRLVVAGESAGANLVTGLTLASCFKRPEPWASAVFERNHPPRAVVPACGIFQVSDVARFRAQRRSWGVTLAALDQVERAYLPHRPAWKGEFDLADPVSMLESRTPVQRPLPPFFLPVGTLDPLLDDNRRLEAALQRRGVQVDARYYAGELHAFHAMMWRPKARACWKHTFNFLQTHLTDQRGAAAIAA